LVHLCRRVLWRLSTRYDWHNRWKRIDRYNQCIVFGREWSKFWFNVYVFLDVFNFKPWIGIRRSFGTTRRIGCRIVQQKMGLLHKIQVNFNFFKWILIIVFLILIFCCRFFFELGVYAIYFVLSFTIVIMRRTFFDSINSYKNCVYEDENITYLMSNCSCAYYNIIDSNYIV
jgi:hypothetical protein